MKYKSINQKSRSTTGECVKNVEVVLKGVLRLHSDAPNSLVYKLVRYDKSLKCYEVFNTKSKPVNFEFKILVTLFCF